MEEESGVALLDKNGVYVVKLDELEKTNNNKMKLTTTMISLITLMILGLVILIGYVIGNIFYF